MDLKETIENLPSSPGVYIMKGASGEVLYVGKANDLRKRVSSYFQPSRRLPERLKVLVSKIKDITYIPTSTSAEALIYENGLIKQLSPQYNVALRDDKSYPLLKLTVNEPFPRLSIIRQKKDDKAIYYGPYTSAKLLKEALKILQRLFPLRTCNRMPKNTCLQFHIKQCLGPCVGAIDEGRYGAIVSELKLFLEGKRSELLKLLSDRMLEASKGARYEEAADYRNRIEALSTIKDDKVRYLPSSELEELKSIIRVPGKLDTIEAFDVSNIMGEGAVGSMIYFYKGKPKKDEYRKFKIKTVTGIDDYSMMRELVRRRYTRLLKEKRRLPDLIVIDGGRGHLSAAISELERLGLERIPTIGIAKEFKHIYVTHKKDPLVLPRESKTLHLLERIRDEAHRFAITYHKHLRSKKIRASTLDDIPGIGKKRKKALLEHFGSINGVKNATFENLLRIEGMNEKSAQSLINYFKK